MNRSTPSRPGLEPHPEAEAEAEDRHRQRAGDRNVCGHVPDQDGDPPHRGEEQPVEVAVLDVDDQRPARDTPVTPSRIAVGIWKAV